MSELTLEQWHVVIANEIDATPVDGDIPDYYELGKSDYAANLYVPPRTLTGDYFEQYLRGHNDAWAAETGRKLSR